MLAIVACSDESVEPLEELASNGDLLTGKSDGIPECNAIGDWDANRVMEEGDIQTFQVAAYSGSGTADDRWTISDPTIIEFIRPSRVTRAGYAIGTSVTIRAKKKGVARLSFTRDVPNDHITCGSKVDISVECIPTNVVTPQIVVQHTGYNQDGEVCRDDEFFIEITNFPSTADRLEWILPGLTLLPGYDLNDTRIKVKATGVVPGSPGVSSSFTIFAQFYYCEGCPSEIVVPSPILGGNIQNCSGGPKI